MADNPLAIKLPRGIELNDPILLASGCCGFGDDYAGVLDPGTIGGIVTKAVSFQPRTGNDPPRLRETPSGLLNCIGLQNPGVESFCASILPGIAAAGYSFIINVVGHSAQEFTDVIAYINSSGQADCIGFKGFELDLSCPNVESGTTFATDPELLEQTVELSRKETDCLLVAKLSPNVTDIIPFAKTAAAAGADAVTIANTWNGVSINLETRCSNLARPSAGLSGAAIRPATLYHVARCHQELPDLPIFGSGGITDAESAIEYLLAGASVLQVGTGLFLNPRCPTEIRDGIIDYLKRHNEPEVSAIVGKFTG